MSSTIADAKARVTHFSSDFFERFESVGCSSFRTESPKQTVALLMKLISPAVLKRSMRKKIQYDRSLEKDVKKFIKVLIREAVNCQAYSTEQKDSPKEAAKPSSSSKHQNTRNQLMFHDTTNLITQPEKIHSAFGRNISKKAFDTTSRIVSSAQRMKKIDDSLFSVNKRVLPLSSPPTILTVNKKCCIQCYFRWPIPNCFVR